MLRGCVTVKCGSTINSVDFTSDNKKLYAHIIAPEDANFMAISTKPENPDEKQNEGRQSQNQPLQKW